MTAKEIKLQQQALDWNQKYPVGTKVTRYAFIRPLREPMPTTRTRSEAWVIGGHTAVVMVDGVSGGVALESVVPEIPTKPG